MAKNCARLPGDRGNLALALPILGQPGHWSGATRRESPAGVLPPSAPWPVHRTGTLGACGMGAERLAGSLLPGNLKAPPPRAARGAGGAGRWRSERVPARPLPIARGGGNAVSVEGTWAPRRRAGGRRSKTIWFSNKISELNKQKNKPLWWERSVVVVAAFL